MRSNYIILSAIVCMFMASTGTSVPQVTAGTLDLSKIPDDPEARAKWIMDSIDDLWRGSSSRAKLIMMVKTEHWDRTLTMEAWSLEKDYSLIKILSPKKEAGTTTLKYENSIYNYLPKTDRTIKISSGMMMGSWMGSHFTNDDLVKESRFAEDYFLRVAFDGEKDGVGMWELELIPKPDAAVVWGKIQFAVRKSDVMPLWAKYYEESGELVRTSSFSDYKEMGGRLIPAKMRLTPDDGSGEFTELIYEEMEFEIGLKKSFFSLRTLKRK